MDYIVAKTGSDANPGTAQNPVLTITRANMLAKTGDRIIIQSGTYRETLKAVSGVTYISNGTDIVTISGADLISGFTLEQGSIYKASMPLTLSEGIDQIFCNGKMVQEVRWPNPGPDISHPIKTKIEKIISVNDTTVVFTDSAITQPDGTWNGAKIHLMNGEEWLACSGTVTKQIGNQLTVNYTPQDVGGGAFTKTYEWPVAGNHYYLYGNITSLNAPGQWYRDAAAIIHLWLADGSDPNLSVIEAKSRKYGFDLTNASNVTIQGINLFACTINSKNSNNNVISNITGTYLSHFTGGFGWTAPDDSGIALIGNNNTIKNSLLQFSAGNGITMGGDNNIAIDNKITDVNYNACDGAGVNMVWGSGNKAQYNEIANCGRDGIKCTGALKVTITNNLFHDFMLQTTDGGAVYTYGTKGTGSIIAYNKCYSGHDNGFGTAGIYLDNGSDGFYVHHNLCYKVDHGFKNNHPSTNNKIDKNTFIGTKMAVDADSLAQFGGTTYTNNIFQGGQARLGTGTTQTNNVMPSTKVVFVDAVNDNYHTVSMQTAGAFSDGDFIVGPRTAPVIVGTPTPPPIVVPPVQVPPITPAITMNTDATVLRAGLCYDQASPGFQPVSLNPTDAKALGHSVSGMWAKYAGLDFTNGHTTFTSMMATAKSCAGGIIELHIDSVTGPLVGSITCQGTGDDKTGWYNYTSQSCTLSGLSGAHDLYLVFKNQPWGVANVLYFYFL